MDAVSEDEEGYDPFEGGHIEVEERDLRLVSVPAVAAGRLSRRLDDAVERIIYRDD